MEILTQAGGKKIKFKKKKNARSFEHAIVLEDTWWGVLRPSRWGAPPAVLSVRPLDAVARCTLLSTDVRPAE